MQQMLLTASARRGLSRGGMVTWSGLLGLVLVTGAVSALRSAEEPKKSPPPAPSLRGILPVEAPEGLLAEDFDVLGKNWKQWGQDVAAEIAKFYEDESLDAAAQREAITSLNRRLEVMETALADERYGKIFDSLVSLHALLSRRVGMAEAALNTLERDYAAARAARLDTARGAIPTAVQDLVKYLNSLTNGAGWLPYVGVDEILGATKDASSAGKSVSVLKAARAKLKLGNSALDEVQQEFLKGSQFTALRGALDTYLERAALPAQPVDRKKLHAQLASLVDALEAYESDRSSESAAAVRKAFGTIRDTLPDEGELIANALRSHYFNYNLRIVASESFLDRAMKYGHTETGPVDDFILGAKVDGTQETEATAGLDLKPADSGARFDITLSGVVQSNTQGVTDQATIYTYGYHRFWATKEVLFDGERFQTEPAKVSVDANTQTTGASTMASGIPIISGIARSIAMGEARKKRPQSEAIAAGRVTDRMAPKFNEEVEQEFGKANDDLEKQVNAPLKKLGLFPSATSFVTTDDQLFANARLMKRGELAAGTPQSPLAAPEGIVIHIHESLLNNSLNELKIAGKTMTEDALLALNEERFSILLGRKVKFNDKKGKTDDKEPTTFVFSPGDPVRLQIDKGVITLTVRTGIKQEEGEEDIPTQIISVPLAVKIEGDNIVLERGTVKVAPVVRPKSLAKQIARAGVVRRKIEAALPNRLIDRHYTVARKDKKPTSVSVTEIKAVGGWLSLVVE